MSLENREQILLRMFHIFDGMRTDVLLSPNQLATVVRNRGVLDQDARPAGAMLDGDEARLSEIVRGRRSMSPGVFEMTPQFFIVLKTRKPKDGDDQGSLLNLYRAHLINRLAADATLTALLGSNGTIQYDGMVTDMKSGASMEGQAQFNFTVKCVVNPYT